MSQHIPSGSRAVRIASVPAAHSYAQNVTAPAREAGRVVLLDDPQPAGAPPGRWWPPVMLDAGWIDANNASFDIMHVHFGFESFSAEQLDRALDALREAGRPVVLTVHDLENPQLDEQHLYGSLLDVFVTGADEIITLTDGAAAEISARWNRSATVIAHPRVLAAPVGADALAGPLEASMGSRSSLVRVGVQLRDLRPNIDAVGTVQSLLDAATHLGSPERRVQVVIDINDAVRDEPTRDRLRSLVLDAPDAEWIEHPRFSDDELAAWLAALDVVVLPYRHGTHSGWLELCWDLDIAVLAPDIGYYREQHPGAVALFDPSSAVSFDYALGGLLARTPEPREPVIAARLAARAVQSKQISDAHLAVYERALSRVHA